MDITRVRYYRTYRADAGVKANCDGDRTTWVKTTYKMEVPIENIIAGVIEKKELILSIEIDGHVKLFAGIYGAHKLNCIAGARKTTKSEYIIIDWE